MEGLILFIGSLCVCLAAPVEEHRVRVVRSDSEESGLLTLLTEVRDTLASANQKPVIPQPMPVAPQPESEPSQPLPRINIQAPSSGPVNDPETNAAAGPSTINLVISTQPQQTELPPQSQPDILQRLQQSLLVTGPVQAASDTMVLGPCGQTPNSPNSPCYLPLPPGMQQPGGLFSPNNPYLTYPTYTGGSFLNPLPYPPYSTNPALPRPYPGVGYNYGVSPLTPEMNRYGPMAPFGMQPNLSITPPIIFREGPTRA